jgi:CRISPR type IV-associated protein Csf2
MKTYFLKGTVTALSSVTHNGGDSFGIDSLLRREKFVQPDGSVEEVPVISGNSIRGSLRDRGMLHMCRLLGYGTDEEAGKVRGLTIGAFHFLFSGGSLSSDGSKSVNIERARELRTLIPLVSIFGGAMGNQIMPGKLDMGKMIPICSETVHLLPKQFIPEKPATIWEYTQREMYTRKDDEKNEHLRTVIEPGAAKMIEAARVVKSAKVAANEPLEDAGQNQQMMYYVETLAAGTKFYWSVSLRDVTDIEFEAFLTTLGEFSKRPFIGGKANVGHGEVTIDFGSWYSIDSRLRDAKAKEVAAPIGEGYKVHLKTEAAKIRLALGAM